METVNNIAAAASKAIWGEPQATTDAANATIVPETKGTEPISGELGDTKKGEPYDLGNADSTTTQNTLSTTISDSTATPTDTNTSTLSPPGLGAKPLDPTIASPTPDTLSHTLSETHIAPLSSTEPDTSSSSSLKPTSEKPFISEHINPNLPDAPVGKPLSTSASSSTTENKAIDLSTAGPKPLSEIRGAAATEREQEKEQEKPSSTANAQGVPTDLQPVDETSGSGTETGTGTGEKYIKSSGVQADGGDFDATRPGAGKEADRLLGKEGVASTGAVGETGRGSTETGSEEEHEHEHEHGDGKKEGKLTHLKEKIKEKLHKH
ncbi:putative glycine-rich cell wall structural protein 1 protein [Botrytis cinerea BcDW1]|uniref:Putative glycine-rich cell wall structural protein 1 protein n=1 Tax=Botryotinia fuckeliana (strain BcDW1) TaxID=1290391 RepID=M7TVD8_BOTF1|nr:putative glycine-rich cell wall structural protein 1 protein [Botrytis cinerea BcDW1]